MTVLLRVVVGLLLLAHGLVHLLFYAEDVKEFSLRRSWALSEPVRRPIGTALIIATAAAFALVAVATWALPLLADGPATAVWSTLTIVASALSLILLTVFWNPHLLIGIAIDVTLIVVAVTDPGPLERLLG